MTGTIGRLAAMKEIYTLFRSVVTPYIGRCLLASVLAATAVAALASGAPVALKWLVDSLASGSRSVEGSVLVALLLVGGQWLGRVLGTVQSYVYAQGERRMYRSLNDRLFHHIIHLPLRYHLNRQTGAINEALTNGLTGFQIVVQVLLVSMLPVVVQLGTVTVVLLHFDQPVLLVFFLVAVVCYGAAFAYGAVTATQAARRVSTAQIEARALMTDSILNYETVKYFTAEAFVRERLDRALRRSELDWMAFFRVRTRNGLLVATIFAAFSAVTTVYAVRQVLAGSMSVGTFVLVNAYLVQLVAPIEQIGAAMQQLSQGFAFLEKLIELFRETPEPTSQRTGDALGGPGRLEFDRVTAAYRSDRTVLREVSFMVPAGKTLAIVGASGAGKSTLVRLLIRMMEPERGQVLIDGVPISQLPLDALRGAIAIVPQDTVLFNDSIAYNIGFGRSGCTQADIEEAARVAELHPFIHSLPEGYNTRVGERGVKLSGGEKQRVAIARAALKRPAMYVFDEATSSLDTRTEQEILRNLRNISSHSTTLIIAHRLSTVIHADEILVLHQGAVVERGTHESLLGEGGRYAELWNAQLHENNRRRASAST